MRFRRYLGILVTAACLGALGIALGTQSVGRAAEPAAQSPAYDQVQAFFATYCTACHNKDDAKGGLVLESFEDLELGGNDGAVYVAGKSQESRIIQQLLGKAEPKMPPKDATQPKPEEIDILVAWIDSGAKGPEPKPASTSPNGSDAPQVEELVLPNIRPKEAVVPAVSAVAWSPDGKQLAAARYREVAIIDPSDGHTVFRLEGHAGRVTALAYSPDGTRLAAAGGEPGRVGEVKIWNPADGNLLATLQGHTDAIYSMEWTPDGKRLATGSYDRLVILWDVESGKEATTLKDHTDAIYAIAISSDGRWLASAAGDRTIKLWDMATGQRRFTLNEPTDALYAVAFRGDSKQLAAGGADKAIRVWNLTDQGPALAKSAFAHDGTVLHLVYTGDGSTLISTGDDRGVKVWDADSLSEKAAFPAQPDWVLALAVSPDGKQLALGRYDGSLALVDPASGQEVRQLLAAAPPAQKQTQTAQASTTPEPGPPSWVPAALASVSPTGGSVGQKLTLTLRGTNVSDATEVVTSNPKLAAAIVKPEKPSDDRGLLTVELTIAADAPAGIHRLLAVTPLGVTEAKPFAVDILPQSAELESADDPRVTQQAQFPATLVGTIDKPGDEDHWKFSAEAGQELVFEVVAQPTGSALAAVLTLSDSSGNVLSRAMPQPGGRDALLGYHFQQAGEYRLTVADAEVEGGGGHYYRIHAGAFPYTRDVFPLAVQRGTSAEIGVAGFNLPAEFKATVAAPADPDPERLTVPIAATPGVLSPQRQVAVSEFPVALEVEPNDTIETSQQLSAPFGVSGRIATHDVASKQDADIYRFDAKKGEQLVVEVTARRLDSPLDSFIEVLGSEGKPVPIATLRPVTRTELTLRDHGSRTTGLRVASQKDLYFDDYVLVGDEVLEVFDMPTQPDTDVNFRGIRGQRLGMFGTTPQAHSVGSAVYKVRVLPPGSTFAPSGMPTVELFARNDDGGPYHGADSYFQFEVPADGTYAVRVTDARGPAVAAFESTHPQGIGYHLSVRPLRPDFRIAMTPEYPAVPRGGSVPIEISADRFEGFDGPIAIRLEGLPAGFTATEGIIYPGQLDTTVTLAAAADAQQPGDPSDRSMQAVGVGQIDGHDVERRTAGSMGGHRIVLLPSSDIRVWVEPTEVVARPGGEAEFTVHVDRANGFGGRVPVKIRPLRRGVRVFNVGLNGVLVTEQQTSRNFKITIEPWVAPGPIQFFAVGQVETAGRNEHASPPVILKIEPTDVAAAPR